jgi:hypothetical protein
MFMGGGDENVGLGAVEAAAGALAAGGVGIVTVGCADALGAAAGVAGLQAACTKVMTNSASSTRVMLE